MSYFHQEKSNSYRRSYLQLSIPFIGVLIGIVAPWSMDGQTMALFNAVPDIAKGIFPSNQFTVADSTTSTGLRVQLPSSADVCDTQSTAVCGTTSLVNRLDGFSVNARVRVCFSGPIDVSSVKNGVSMSPVSSRRNSIGLNQIIFDPQTNCLFGKPNDVLAQQTRYLLTVRNSISDGTSPVVRAPAFNACLSTAACSEIASLIGSDTSVVAATVFTTMSVTPWLEAAYRYVDQTQTGLALPAGFPWVFPLANLASVQWNPDNGVAPAQNIPLTPALKSVGSVAFGLIFSPNYLNISGPDAGSITTRPDSPISVPSVIPGTTSSVVPVSFHVFLPKAPPPQQGYPIVIYGHGLSDNQFGAPTDIASTLADAGYATVAMEITGHGYGPKSTVTLQDKFGFTYSMQTPGRGIQLAPGQKIGPTDGCVLPGPLAIRDCGRQTAVDLFALVKTIERSNGLLLGLNPNKIYYVGQSFGSIYGTMFQAVAPDVQTSVLNAGGGPFVDVARLAINGRPLAQALLCSLKLLNVPSGNGANTCAAGFSGANALREAYFNDTFNDNYVYRDQAPVINNVDGAIEIQAALESAEWIGMPGDALAYAPHLSVDPLGDNPAKHTFLQFHIGDLEVPNPTNIALARAAGGMDTTSVLNFPLAVGSNLALAGVMDPAIPYPFPILPHRILSNPTIFGSAPGDSQESAIAIAMQKSVVNYFNSDGTSMPDTNSYLTTPYAGVPLFAPGLSIPPGLNFLH